MPCKGVKKLIASYRMLHYHNVSEEVTLQCDALKQGGHPVTFTSRALIPTERNYARIERELLATLLARDRFDQYVFGHDIYIETHYKSLEKSLENLF